MRIPKESAFYPTFVALAAVCLAGPIPPNCAAQKIAGRPVIMTVMIVKRDGKIDFYKRLESESIAFGYQGTIPAEVFDPGELDKRLKEKGDGPKPYVIIEGWPAGVLHSLKEKGMTFDPETRVVSQADSEGREIWSRDLSKSNLYGASASAQAVFLEPKGITWDPGEARYKTQNAGDTTPAAGFGVPVPKKAPSSEN